MEQNFRRGGYLASIILIAFGIGAIAAGIIGRAEVGDKLEQERIVGTPDMTEEAAAAAAREAGLTDVDLPECDVAGETVDNGTRAKCFADHMRLHALEATGGKTYAEMPRFLGANGEPTNDAEQAEQRPGGGGPVDNPQRNIWVTETALATALNTSFFAQQVALFSIIMGVALLLTGIGFLVLTRGLVGPAQRPSQTSAPGPS
jgi:hypothetical protein